MKPKFLIILAILGATALGKPTKDATKDEKSREEAKAGKKAEAKDVCDNFVPLDYWFEAKALKGASKPGAAAKLRAKTAGCPVGTKLACQFKPAQCVLEEKPKARTFHDWQKHCDKFKLSLPEIVPYEMEMTGKIVKEIYGNKKLKGHEWIWLNVKVVEKESEAKAQWLTSMETFPQELTEIDKIEHHPKYKPGDCVAYHAEGHFVPLDCKTKLVSACFMPLKTTMIPKGSNVSPKHPHHKEHDHKGNPKAKRNSAVDGKLFKDFENEHEQEEDEEKKPQNSGKTEEKPQPAPKVDQNEAVLNSEQKPKPEAKMETKTEKNDGKEELEEEDEPVGFGLKNVPEVLRPTFIPAFAQNEAAKDAESGAKNLKFAPDEVDELEEAAKAAASSTPQSSRSPAGSTPAPEALKTKLLMTTVKPRSGKNQNLRMERQGDENLPEDHQERAIAGVGPETEPESSRGPLRSSEAPEASKPKLPMTSMRPSSARSGNLRSMERPGDERPEEQGGRAISEDEPERGASSSRVPLSSTEASEASKLNLPMTSVKPSGLRSGNLRSMERPGDENLPEDYEGRIKPENTDASEKSSNPQKPPQEGKDDEKEEDEDVKNLFGLDDDDVASNSTGGSNSTVNRAAAEFEPEPSRAPKQRNASWDAIAFGREKQIPSASTILLSTPNQVTTPRNDTQVVAGPPASQNQSETKDDTSQRPLAFGPVGGARFFDAKNSDELSKKDATTVSKRTVVIWVTGIRYVTKPRRG
ncbi:unnamed protein product, partial [Mesorhabditis spiculigera]